MRSADKSSFGSATISSELASLSRTKSERQPVWELPLSQTQAQPF
jgi:hypothetical protein